MTHHLASRACDDTTGIPPNPHRPAPRRRRRIWACAAAACAAATLAVPQALTPAATAAAQEPPSDSPATVDTPELHTWWHDKMDTSATGAIGDDTVRRSPFYSTAVRPANQPRARYDSFTYLSVPRSGEGKRGYTGEDGADFAADNNLTMSWSTFEYATDVDVDVSLDTGQTIASADQVTIRPTTLGFTATLIDDHTVRIRVPYSEDGHRFSVEFDPQLITTYNDASAGSGKLTMDPASGQTVGTEPRNAMLVFAQPTQRHNADATAPDPNDPHVRQITPGAVTDLDEASDVTTLYFGPGLYWMGPKYHAKLPANITRVHLAAGAYVKGAFQFLTHASSLEVSGHGVLSGEQYPYEAETNNGYDHRSEDNANCHGSCVKMLQFESTGAPQTLTLDGVTVANPPYHSFVMYGVEDGPFAMRVNNYQQVGGWYWQTDGLELYRGTTLANSFFHANDDAIKLYHSHVRVRNTVVWKNENGPVFQWGWTPRDVEDVVVDGTSVIHNRMYWNDQKRNTCIINSASSYLDGNASDTADTTHTIRDLTISNTHVEGMANCAMRIYPLQNLERITIDGLHIDSWNGLTMPAQESFFDQFTNAESTPVHIGNQTADGMGLLLHNYTVGGVPVIKAGNNWAHNELGRLNFDPRLYDNWDATADGQPQGASPALAVEGLEDGQTAEQRTITVRGTTNATTVGISVNGGAEQRQTVDNGAFTAAVTLPEVHNTVRVTATGANGIMNVKRYTVYALGQRIGTLTDPQGDDNGPGSYVYPADGSFAPGGFDLRTFDMYSDGDVVRFATSVQTPITNPWGGNHMSTQRFHILLADTVHANGAAEDGSPTPQLPGTNTFTRGPWRKAVVVDGRNDGARYGGGVYDATPSMDRVADVSLDLIRRNTIVASAPRAAFADLDLGTAGYQVSVFSSAEDSEGIGNVRPVYGAACWNGEEDCPSYVHQFRFGGGLGIPDDSPARDSITTDSNAIDAFTGKESQTALMDLRQSQVTFPFLRLETVAGDPSGNPAEPSDGAAQPTKPEQARQTGHSQPPSSQTPTAWQPSDTRLADSGSAALPALSAAIAATLVAAVMLAAVHPCRGGRRNGPR